MSKKKPAAKADAFVDASSETEGADRAASEEYSPALAPAVPPTRRRYTAQQEKDHDLYKAKLAKFIRDLAWSKDGSGRQEVEHVHFFHTIDSSGREQTLTNQVGGHFHEIKVIPSKDPNGVPTVECGPAMTWGTVGKGKAKRRVMMAPKIAVDTDNEEVDTHTHEMEYLGSQRIQMRKPNVEAAKFQAEMAAKQDIKVPGILG